MPSTCKRYSTDGTSTRKTADKSRAFDSINPARSCPQSAQPPGEPVVLAQQAQDTPPRGRSVSRRHRLRSSRGDRPSSSVRNSSVTTKQDTCGGRPKPRRVKTSHITEPLQNKWCLSARDARACAKILIREDIGLTCIYQLGLLDEARLIQLTKGLSFIGSCVIKMAWLDLKNARFSFMPAEGPVFSNPNPV